MEAEDHSAPAAEPESSPAGATFTLPSHPPSMAPSATHQPELLLLQLRSASYSQNYFTGQNAFRFYIQFRNALRRLGMLCCDPSPIHPVSSSFTRTLLH